MTLSSDDNFFLGTRTPCQIRIVMPIKNHNLSGRQRLRRRFHLGFDADEENRRSPFDFAQGGLSTSLRFGRDVIF